MNDTPTYAMLADMRDRALIAERELAAATEQRDEAREVLRQIRDNEVNPEDEADKFLRDHVPSELSKVREQLATVTEQRDEAVNNYETAQLLSIRVGEQRDEWKAKYIQQNKDLGHELRDPNGTIWSECKRLQTELTAVKEKEIFYQLQVEQRDRFADYLKNTETELIAVTEQRDRLLEEREQWRLSSVCRELTEQRDRLAEALKDYMSAFGQGLEAHGIPMGEQQVEADANARKAIQSLTPKP